MLPHDELTRNKAAGETRKFGREEWRARSALLILSPPVTFFWATYEQMGNTIALWADGYTDRSINLLFWRGEIPTTWFQAFNPFMIFLFTPFILALWRAQSTRGAEPTTVSKMAYGCFLNAAANMILFAGALYAGADKASWMWLTGYFVVITIGELYLSPTALRWCRSRARALPLDDDGRVVSYQFLRQLPCRLYRQLLEQHAQERFLPGARHHRRARGSGGAAVQSATQGDAEGITARNISARATPARA
jgi:hypothetical protein